MFAIDAVEGLPRSSCLPKGLARARSRRRNASSFGQGRSKVACVLAFGPCAL